MLILMAASAAWASVATTGVVTFSSTDMYDETISISGYGKIGYDSEPGFPDYASGTVKYVFSNVAPSPQDGATAALFTFSPQRVSAPAVYRVALLAMRSETVVLDESSPQDFPDSLPTAPQVGHQHMTSMDIYWSPNPGYVVEDASVDVRFKFQTGTDPEYLTSPGAVLLSKPSSIP